MFAQRFQKTRWLWAVLAFVAVVPVLHADSPVPLPKGHVFFETGFEGADALKGWTGRATLAPGGKDGQALLVQRMPGAAAGAAMVQMALPVEKMRGYLVYFSAQIKAENISPKPRPWNGVKFMAPLVAPSGKSWPAATLDAGTFDWRRATFAVRVPDDAESMSLMLGLEAVTGKAWFDDIRVTVAKPPLAAVQPRAVSGPVYKGHALPRLRGAMVSPNIDDESLRLFGRQWNANVIRWQLIRPGRAVRDPADLAAYDAWLDTALTRLDAILPVCREAGLYVVIDLHSPPGGRAINGGYAAANAGLFNSPLCQAKFVDVWRRIAQRYKDAEGVWGYDLANEPVEDAIEEGLADWQELAQRAARAVRQIDPRRAIIVEPAQWGNPSGFVELRPIDVPNVVYSFHMYLPHSFTHQGVHGPSGPVSYPGVIEGKKWDKVQLEAAMKPAVDFQKNYGVHIYVGEFSAIRWAPDDSAYRYLKDLIELFEAHGWDWTYHAFREWDGWSVEHGADRADHKPATTPTSRETLLRGWLAKNRHVRG
jgi:hypothetical protein